MFWAGLEVEPGTAGSGYSFGIDTAPRKIAPAVTGCGFYKYPIYSLFCQAGKLTAFELKR
ncbi:hypothetical protein [uncultured Meiothermus sp.]|jgi:hypothetical protein|uniref:hypothetical protein n=1 Tax=uncultured Meiothermus sp. TaxID=157471 RepID=UPI00262750BF|nr:hypothetical protein [uncultured Meiothermus sp.]